MELAASILTQLMGKNLKAVMKRVMYGIQNLVPFLHLMKNAELTLVVSSSVHYNKFILCLASKTLKLICFSGSMS